jgi:hypothetical protein
MEMMNTDPEPRTFKQAMHGDQSDRWREAATLEYNTLIQNGTWEIVDLPYGEKAIGSGWVFKVKHNVDGSIERFKARLVAKGYSQRPGLDYNESFAPTFRPATLRIIMALAAVEDLELRSVDITSAFTNGDLDEEIYMRQPEGFHVGSPNQVCRLRKSLYGLKQSARQWNKKLHSVLTELGFKRIESDRSVYIYSNGEVRIIVPTTSPLPQNPPLRLTSMFNFFYHTLWPPAPRKNKISYPKFLTSVRLDPFSILP